MMNLNDAIAFAAAAHNGQIDKGGHPYILHPLRVMLAMESDDERIVAVLHDVAEDTPHSIADMVSMGLAEHLAAPLQCLTRSADEDYDQFVARVKCNALATKVKLADIGDNMNLSRLPHITPKDEERLERYRRAARFLREC
jgi:(p)ppGpp synthase/HD superfamily hydrolase